MNRLLTPFSTDIPQLKATHFVSWHNVDFSGFVSLYSLFNFTQETAWKHAEEIGFGFEKLQEKNMAWVLFGMRIKVLKSFPQWQQQLYIETQPKGISGMFANRDYRMLKNNNELFAVGSSNWLVMDTQTRRPQRLDSVFDTLRFVEMPDNLIRRLKPKGVFPFLLKTYEVKTSDIDYYGHVNNAKYIAWITDLYSPEQLLAHPVDEVLVNFLHETRFGDVLEIYADQQENKGKVLYKMRRVADDTIVFMAEVDWK